MASSSRGAPTLTRVTAVAQGAGHRWVQPMKLTVRRVVAGRDCLPMAPPEGAPKHQGPSVHPAEPKGVWDLRGRAHESVGRAPAPPAPRFRRTSVRLPGAGPRGAWEAPVVVTAVLEGQGRLLAFWGRAQGQHRRLRGQRPGHRATPPPSPSHRPGLCHLWAGRPWGLQGLGLSSPGTPHLDSRGGGSYRWAGWHLGLGDWAEYPCSGRVPSLPRPSSPGRVLREPRGRSRGPGSSWEPRAGLSQL